MTSATATRARRLLRTGAAALALAGVGASGANADSTPVGPLPKTSVTTVSTTKGSLVSIAVPSQLQPTGLVWRIARPVKARILQQVAEGELSGTTVLVFRVVGKGKATVVLALTRGDSSPKAIAAVRYSITAR
jgi:hypothetical protein